MDIEVYVGEDRILFPEGTPQAEIEAALQKQYGAPASDTPITDSVETGVGRAQGALMDFQERSDNTTKQFQERAMGGFTGGGIGVSPAAHVAGAGVEYAAGRGMDFLASFVPQEIQDTLGTWASAGYTAAADKVGEFLANNPKAMEGVNALKEGYANVAQWMDNNPDLARDFETIFDVASIAMPAAKVGPLVDTTVGQAGKRLSKKGVEQSINERRRGVRELIYPDERYGEGITDESGPLRTREYTGSSREDEIAEALLLTDTVKGNRSYGYNQRRAYEAVEDQKNELHKVIAKAGNPKVDREQLLSTIQGELNELGRTPGTELLVGDRQTMAENLLNTAIELFDSTDGKAMSVLQARREFDKIVRRSRGNTFDPEKASAISSVNRIVRDALNESVRQSVGTKAGNDVYHYLRQQHLLLEGADTLYDNMKKEEMNVLTRLWANVLRLGHLPRTPLALGATVVAAAPFLPTVSVAAGAGLAGYGVKKAVTSATSKKALGELLTNVNKAIKQSENSAMINQLKADRLLLIEMMREKTPEEERIPLKGAGNG